MFQLRKTELTNTALACDSTQTEPYQTEPHRFNVLSHIHIDKRIAATWLSPSLVCTCMRHLPPRKIRRVQVRGVSCGHGSKHDMFG